MTHAEKVLRLLSDNEPHSYREGYRLGVMLHSRVADLRKPSHGGHDIRCWRDGENYLYQLVGTVREGEAVGADGLAADSALPHGQPSTAVPPAPTGATCAGPGTSPGKAPPGPAQLSVF